MPRYFLGTLIYFWIPVAIMGFIIRKKWDALSRKAFWYTILTITPMTFVMEYVYLYFDIWNFSEEMDPLLGINIFGAPIEEFSFWFGAGPFILLVYLLIGGLKAKKKTP